MKSYIGYSTNIDIRYQATSGGVGTSLVKWMFETKRIDTAISFEFDVATLSYMPKIIYSFDEYKICGSIYQEIDLINFIKLHIDKIKGTFACFTLPCQTKAVKAIVEKAGHEVITIGLTCSSQQTLEATKYLLKRVGIDKKEITKIQYRGNGWPSGIQIETRNGEKVFVANNHSIWTKIFHSRLFIRPKCFMCQDTLNRFCDLTLADPWLKRFSTEKIGKTLVLCNTAKGENIIKQCANDKGIILEYISYDELMKSQNVTILRKKSYRHTPNITKLYRKILDDRMYRKIVLTPLFFQVHCRLKNLIEKYLLYKQRHSK